MSGERGHGTATPGPSATRVVRLPAPPRAGLSPKTTGIIAARSPVSSILAVTTLAFAIALDSYFFNPDKFASLLNIEVARPMLWQRFDLENNYDMYLLCLAFLGLSILVSLGVRKARSGRVIIATRDNQRAADA